MLHYCYPFEWSLKSSIIKWCENSYSGSMFLRCLSMRYPSTEWSKYSNCTINPSKYGKENQGIHFHHHHQECLIHYIGREQMPLLTDVIQCRIRVRPGYFISRVRPAWPRQNVTRITRPGFNPGDKQVSTTWTSMTAALSWIESLH